MHSIHVDSMSMMHHRRLWESFPSFSNENLTFEIRNNENGLSLNGDPAYQGSTVGFFINNDYKQWWFNSSTSQLFVSGTVGTFCLEIQFNGPHINVCNSTSEIQKWTYDGNHIISFNNTCLTGLDLVPCRNGTFQEWSLYFSQGLPSDSTYEIQNKVIGVLNEKLCIDVSGSDFTVGSILSVYRCNGDFNQRFWRPSSDLRIETALGFCIDWQNGTDITRLNYCSDALSQKWTYDGTYIKSVLDPTLCLTIDFLNGRGYNLIATTCTTEPRMQWIPSITTPSVGKSFSIQSQYSKMCIDVPGSQYKIGQTLKMWECNGTPAQLFWRSDTNDLHLHSSNGKCIDWYKKQTIILNTCQESTGQKWIFDGYSFSSLADSNMCLSYGNTLNTRGAELTVSSCDSDPKTQWTQFSYGSETTLDHFGDFSGFNFDMFRCPNNTMMTNIAASYDFVARVVLNLDIFCEDGSIGSFGKGNIESTTSVIPLTFPSCRQGFTAVQGGDFSKALVCATPPSSSPNGFSYCLHSNTSRQRIIGVNIWYSPERFYGIEPVCDYILGNYGGNFFTFQCPPGSYLSKIDGNGNARVNGLTVSCGTGLDSNLTYGWTYHVGNTTRSTVDNKWCRTSIQGVTIWFDVEEALYGILPHCNGTMIQKIIGVQGGKEKNDFTCPTGTSIVGIHGWADKSNVYRLSFICKDASPPSNNFTFLCPTGKRIVKLSSNGNPFIQQIQAKCDDGNFSDSEGDPGGNSIVDCSGGFTGANITYGENIGQISLNCKSGPTQRLGTTMLGNKTQFSCLNNSEVVVGYIGSHRIGLEGLFFICQKVDDPPLPPLISRSDRAAIGYGLITGLVILGIPSFVVWFILRRRHKQEYRQHDEILPMR